ncbi:MAG: phosphate acetyltransferase [Proteobacteria bacterium]|nr:phosphate acetyltransferase [Pseudomonadota bacterium]
MTKNPPPSPFITTTPPQCPTWLLASGRRIMAGGLPIAIAGGDSEVAVETAQLMVEAGLGMPHLIGTPEVIATHAKTLGLDMTGIAVTPATTEDGVMEAAAGLVQQNKLGGLMKGHIHTDRFMSGVLKRDHGIRGEGRMVHVFALFPPDNGDREKSKPLLISDAAVNVAPDLKTSQAALEALTTLAIALGSPRPRIAIISATETPIPSVPSSLVAQELAEWGRVNLPESDISGPLSFDLALSPEAASIKGIAPSQDPVAGYADGLLMPDIVSGNVLFKSMVWFKGACAGGVVVGGKVPIMLTSRADPPSARLASIALAAHLLA